MNEQEAAERLCALLNEIQAAGYDVYARDEHLHLSGGTILTEPTFDDDVWEVHKP